MPTDKEAGAVKVQLENIFVPLGFYKKEDDKYKKHTIKDVLNSQKSAILAKPGGGKSTLIRRIALAYAYPDRRKKVRDGLPDKELFPIYIRCRDLGEDANNSILEIISLIVKRAEIRQYEEAFNALVEDYLQNGQALLLIDGLDEIANERTRISFVNQLRTFLAIYPATRLLITSREAGFRAVAETLAGHCDQYSIANFQEKEIRELSLKWHNAVLGEGVEAKDESKKVCDIIIADNRIMSLAENPLLLTTLLFVKRWVGYLPTKKCQLYEEMIKLLLVTWNAIAHEKLDMDETEPQLAYIAYYMTSQGKQKITKGELAKCVIEARRALPELLGYTALSPANFIAQVEERSSLLIQLGLEENENGKLVPSYEFSHLSFQEYLTAKAVAEEWLPKESANVLDIIKGHLSDEHWKEVIPIITVLLGRKAKPIIEFLLEECRSFEDQFNSGLVTKKDFEANMAPFHLANCIASEVPISVDMLEESFNFIIKGKRNIDYVIRRHFSYTYNNGSVYDVILKSKYGEKYKDIVEQKLSYSIDKNYIYEYCDAWLMANAYAYKNVNDIANYFISESQRDHIKGALLTMNFAFNNRHGENDSAHAIKIIDITNKNLFFEKIYSLLNTNEALSLFAATWSIAWSGYNESDIIPDDLYPLIFEKLIKLWMSDVGFSELNRTISWSLLSIVRPNLYYGKIVGQELYECIERKFNEPQNEFDAELTISLAYLTGYWSANEVANKFRLSQKNLFRYREPSRFWKESSLNNKIIAEELSRLKNKRYSRE